VRPGWPDPAGQGPPSVGRGLPAPWVPTGPVAAPPGPYGAYGGGPWAPVAPPPPVAGPVPSAGQRVGARFVDGIVHLILLAIPFALIHGDRVLARLFVGVAIVTAFEALFTVRIGSTPGKLIAGTRVVELDEPGLQVGTAVKRGLLASVCTLIVICTPLVLLSSLVPSDTSRGAVVGLGFGLSVLTAVIMVSVLGSPLRRGFVDRMCATFVTNRGTTLPVTRARLAELVDDEAVPHRSPWGPMGTFEQRRRARAGRLDDAPVLVLALVAIVFATSIPHVAPLVVVALGLGWEVVFVLDETWRLSRFGGTSGHLDAGLAVVDLDTGEAPEPLNCLVRAVLVSLPLYMLPAGVILCATLIGDHPLMLVPAIVCGALTMLFVLWPRYGSGRGLHDLAAHTVVVHPHRSPTGTAEPGIG